MPQKFQKTKSPIIQLDRKTAFLSALSISIFFVLVQLVILVYSFYMGENVGERLSARISLSEHSTEPINLLFERVILFLVNTFLLYLFFRVEFWILTRFSLNKKKAWFSFFVLFLFVGGISTMISQLLGIWFKGDLTAYQYSIIRFVKDLILFITSVFVTNLIYLIIKNQERIEENKNLTIENFKNRYNALKNQTDPHFLFNSLNSLNGLIGYDDERAHEYLIQLSSVFRYTIQEESVVTLSEELEFAESYIYLMKIRYGDALSVNIQIPDNHRDYYILPFAIQTLVENAVKHNIASLQKPLNLVIKSTDDEAIIVENNLQPRQDVRDGNGLGLSNLNERYWLMFRKNINIQADNSIFRVEIPLIKNLEKYSDKFHNIDKIFL
jgi:sensor histidine kinase YesM